MYNKIFTKILDSSIWLEPDATRIVWLTLLAAMDEDGFAQFASVPNLAHRARVSLAACKRAVESLEGPDENSSDKDREGRRIERVPGGWVVLNAAKYRDLVTRAIQRERTRERVKRFRERLGNADVTPSNVPVTQSEAYTEAEAKTEREHRPRAQAAPLHSSHRAHAHCGRICVPAFLHSEFVRRWPPCPNADMEVRDWYTHVERQWADKAEALPEPKVFWQARFLDRWPAAAPKAGKAEPKWMAEARASAARLKAAGGSQ